MNGLFDVTEHKGVCTCDESIKKYNKRNYAYYAYFCHNPRGKAKYKYDNRKLLRITCNKCGATWVDYNSRSKYWDVINDTPYTESELFYTAAKKTIGDKIKEWIYARKNLL